MAIEIRIPKNVGGVRIGKKIRRRANKTLKAATSPALRNLAREALLAVRAPRGTAWQHEQSERKETDEMCETRIHIDGDRVAETFRTAAIAGLRTFLDGLEQGFREAKAEREAAAEPEPAPQPTPEPGPRPRRGKPKASGA